jgi:hypothetical protein
MKLTMVLHFLGLTGSVLHLSKTVIPVNTCVEKEMPLAKSRLLAVIGSESSDGVKSHGALVLLPTTYPLAVSFSSYITLSLQMGFCSPCLQASHRGLCFGRQSIIARTNRRIHLRRGNDSANPKSEWELRAKAGLASPH